MKLWLLSRTDSRWEIPGRQWHKKWRDKSPGVVRLSRAKTFGVHQHTLQHWGS